MFGCVTGEVGSPGSHGGDSQRLTAHTGDTAGSPVLDSDTLQILSPCTSGPQLFLHQGLISWKAIFPWTGGWKGDGFGNESLKKSATRSLAHAVLRRVCIPMRIYCHGLSEEVELRQ